MTKGKPGGPTRPEDFQAEVKEAAEAAKRFADQESRLIQALAEDRHGLADLVRRAGFRERHLGGRFGGDKAVAELLRRARKRLAASSQAVEAATKDRSAAAQRLISLIHEGLCRHDPDYANLNAWDNTLKRMLATADRAMESLQLAAFYFSILGQAGLEDCLPSETGTVSMAQTNAYSMYAEALKGLTEARAALDELVLDHRRRCRACAAAIANIEAFGPFELAPALADLPADRFDEAVIGPWLTTAQTTIEGWRQTIQDCACLVGLNMRRRRQACLDDDRGLIA